MKTLWLIILSFLVVGCNSTNPAELKIEVLPANIQVLSTVEKPVIVPTLEEIMKQNKFALQDISILIDKSDYQLNVLVKDSIIKNYHVVFGGNQTDDKLRQGDSCTPEGRFKIRSKYPHKSWSKFIWVDYPNENSWAKHNAAKANKTIPTNSKIGGEIGIHGVPVGFDYLVTDTINWTAGCISLSTKDINEIYPYFHKGIWVEIRK